MEKTGLRMFILETRASFVTRIMFSVMSFTSVRHVRITAVLVMIHWDATPAMRTETGNAWRDGRETTALTPSALRTAASGMVTASHLVSASVVWDGRGHPAASVCITRDVYMGLARSHGSVCARRAGEASSVTRTSTTAPTTNPVLMAPPAPTPDRAAIPAPADQDMEAQTVSWRLMSVIATPARMVAVATIWRTITPVHVLRDSMGRTVRSLQ